MKKIKSLLLAGILTLSMGSAFAGAGLSIKAVSNLAKGDFLAGAIGGGLGAALLIGGIDRVQNGKVGWGVFMLVLNDMEREGLVNEADSELLENADSNVQDDFLAIINNEEISAEDKEELLAELEF